ncbi:aspartyl (acid) protease [Cryptosporidium bovis]|uniref:aspartyl (acid) protease n=1 Tax=Cryptosporidium bovis TaxID=310047 RepID=UPI00351A4A14|nr:aspartyl (acid) protease [Cryptosporidium bovis]
MSRMKSIRSLFILFSIFFLGYFNFINCRIQIKAYGSIVSTAYFYSDIFVGLPTPQRQSVILDTGSNLLAFSSTQCQQCGTHLDPYYDPFKSTTMKEVPCHSYCKVCVNKRRQCAYTIHYLEGSSLSGSYFEDFVALRNEKGDSKEPAPYVVGLATIFGGITHETNLFFTQAASGILGLAYTASSQERAPLFQTWNKKSKYVKDAILSMCFSSEGGMISFGGYNSEYWLLNGSESATDKSFRQQGANEKSANRFLGFSYISSSTNNANSASSSSKNPEKVSWTPLSIMNGNYYVHLTKAFVHQTKIILPTDSSGNVKPIPLVIDSGTTLTYFPEQIFIQILNVINQRIAETETRSTFRTLVEAGSKVLEYMGIKEPSEEAELDVGIKQVSIFPGDVPGAALHRKRIYRTLKTADNEIITTDTASDSTVNSFNATVHLEELSNNTLLDSIVNHINNTKNEMEGNEFDIDSSVSRILLETTKGERCWKLREPSEMSRFPIITLGFPNLKVKWEPSQYLYKKYRNTYCLGFDSDKSFLVLGASFFINKDVIIDVKNSRVSFVRAKCPQIAHARRTSTVEMTQLLKDTSTSSPESIMKSEVLVFDSNTHQHLIPIQSDKSSVSESKTTSTNSKLTSNRYTDENTVFETEWDQKNLTMPSSLSSSSYPSSAQSAGATNHSTETGLTPLNGENKTSSSLHDYLYEKMSEHNQYNYLEVVKNENGTVSLPNYDSSDSNYNLNLNLLDGFEENAESTNNCDVNGDSSGDGKCDSNKSSGSLSTTQPTYVHWLLVLITALIHYSFSISNQIETR